MVRIENTSLDKVLLIKPEVFEDFRGETVEIWNNIYYQLGDNQKELKFVIDKISVSYRNVFRGLHGDLETWKLISCLYGRIFLVVLNCDKENKDFGKWKGFILSDKNRYQILVPPKFANGHLVLSDNAVFWYKWSEYYDLSKQFSIKYNDPRFNIKLPVKESELILSERDT